MRNARLLPAAITLLFAACSQGAGPSSSPSPPAPTTASTSGPSSHTTQPTPTGPTAGPTESPTEFPPLPPAVPVAGLPEQGVAVEHDGAVDLHNSFDGALIDRLDGFAIYDSTAPPSHLVLERDGWYYLLDEFRRALIPLRSERAAHRLTGSDPVPIDDPAPTYQGKALTGHWRYITYNPRYSEQEMGQWSGECEVPTAFFIEEDEGEVVPVTGEAAPADTPESFALGWTKRGQAVVFLPNGACGVGADRPGIYLFREPGEGRLLVRTPKGSFARTWGNTIAD